jgi:hypothetical protein
MEAHPHAHVEHQKTGHRTLDAVVSVCAMITSAVSILLAYHTGHNMERLVHASSWPALQLATGNGSTRDGLQLDFAVINAGVGPAQIHTLEFLCDGATVAWTQDVEKLLEACCAEAVGQARAAAGKRWEPQVSTAPVAGSFLSPRERTGVFSWPRTEADARPWDALDRARVKGRVKMRVCYCSVFDECWIAETNRFPPRPVPSCSSMPSPAAGH